MSGQPPFIALLGSTPPKRVNQLKWEAVPDAECHLSKQHKWAEPVSQGHLGFRTDYADEIRQAEPADFWPSDPLSAPPMSLRLRAELLNLGMK